MKLRVTINGVENTLTCGRHGGTREHQYLTCGNASSHAFAHPLAVGQRSKILEAL